MQVNDRQASLPAGQVNKMFVDYPTWQMNAGACIHPRGTPEPPSKLTLPLTLGRSVYFCRRLGGFAMKLEVNKMVADFFDRHLNH